MTCGWIIGRGASIAHGIKWMVPKDWHDDYLAGKRTRESLIAAITGEMRRETDATAPTHYARMIELLLERTAEDQIHYLTTTNWDYLAQRAFNEHREKLGDLSIPYNTLRDPVHFNGSAEPGDWQNRSPFVLEVDDQARRRRGWSYEAQLAIGHLLIAQMIVIVGMSFECVDDRAFLRQLASMRTKGTYLGAHLVLVDPNAEVLKRNHEFLLQTFRQVTVEEIPLGFDEWVKKDLATVKVPIFRKL